MPVEPGLKLGDLFPLHLGRLLRHLLEFGVVAVLGRLRQGGAPG